MSIGSSINPIQKKVTSEHITQVLEITSKHDEREYDLHKCNQENEAIESRSNRRYWFASLLLVVVLVLIVLFLFKNEKDILAPVLTGIGGLVAGFMGGWGVGKSGK